ncbi:pyroglutamyl-peptidase I [Kocuria atrinae]|uniref:pyroglutamyl-peptidase I n=1 Tax=Kocuria atrinae TaxID=592377 RepID=UPI0002E006CC|nr:pyroglutamyl-peptidase I [Kocuria atrinae]
MKILVTGFEPFGQDTENSSGMVVERLRKLDWGPGFGVVTAILPVTWAGSVPTLLEAIETHQPHAVVALGEAGGRAVVTPERRARNLGHGRIPDNDDAARPPSPLDDGPEWLESRIDPESLIKAIRSVNVPAAISDDAGAFLCNAVYRALLSETDLPGAFIHVPAVRTRGTATVGQETDPGAAASSSELSIDQLTEAIAASVSAVAADLMPSI